MRDNNCVPLIYQYFPLFHTDKQTYNIHFHHFLMNADSFSLLYSNFCGNLPDTHERRLMHPVRELSLNPCFIWLFFNSQLTFSVYFCQVSWHFQLLFSLLLDIFNYSLKEFFCFQIIFPSFHRLFQWTFYRSTYFFKYIWASSLKFSIIPVQ